MAVINKSLHISELRNTFAHGEFISVSDILDFYSRFEKDIKRSTVDWRIYELNRIGILHRTDRGKYTLGETDKDHFFPEMSKSLKQLYLEIRRQFPFIDLCIWSTKLLNEFMLHQPGRFYTILETEKDASESVFHNLKEHGKDVYLDPSQDFLDRYVIHQPEPVVIINLTTEAPVQQIDNVKTVTLEKMLVDIYCDKVIFSANQGTEMKQIYRTAFDKYYVSERRILRYASRRNKKDEIEKLINEILRNGNKFY